MPADGTYYLHLGDAQRQGGPEYAYRLRISPPRPDFALRVVPSCIWDYRRLSTLSVHALRKDGFDGEIALRFQAEPFGLLLGGGVIPSGQDRIRLTLATAPLLSADPIRVCLEGRALIDGKEVVRAAVPAEEMTQAFFYKHVVPARLIVVPEDRDRFREEATAPPRRASRSRHRRRRIIPDTDGDPEQQPVRIPAGGTAEVQVAWAGARRSLQAELSDPPEGITVDRTSWTESGLVLVLCGDATKAMPKLNGNLMANAFLQTTVTEADGKTREVRNFIGPLPALQFEVVKP